MRLGSESSPPVVVATDNTNLGTRSRPVSSQRRSKSRSAPPVTDDEAEPLAMRSQKKHIDEHAPKPSVVEASGEIAFQRRSRSTSGQRLQRRSRSRSPPPLTDYISEPLITRKDEGHIGQSVDSTIDKGNRRNRSRSISQRRRRRSESRSPSPSSDDGRGPPLTHMYLKRVGRRTPDASTGGHENRKFRSTPGPSWRRSRSRSPPPLSDDEIDPSLVGTDGLHAGQKATKSRRRNPGKYTDKSMRQVQSKRSKKRERSAWSSLVTGGDDYIRGTCVNDLGAIKNCRDLVTRVNYRSTYVNRDRLPLQMLFAMLLDEQPDTVRTYDKSLVKAYLAGVIARALSGEDALEPSGYHNLLRFSNRALSILAQLDNMVGDVDPIAVLAERYLQSRMTAREAITIIRNSIRSVGNTTVLNILKNLRTLVNETIPYVRLWAYDNQSPEDITTIMLRRGQLKVHPLEQLKNNLDSSIKSFGARGTNDVDFTIRRTEAVSDENRAERRMRADEESVDSGLPTTSGTSSERKKSRTVKPNRSHTKERNVTQPTRGMSEASPSDDDSINWALPPPTPGRSLETQQDSPVSRGRHKSRTPTPVGRGRERSKTTNKSHPRNPSNITDATAPSWMERANNFLY